MSDSRQNLKRTAENELDNPRKIARTELTEEKIDNLTFRRQIEQKWVFSNPIDKKPPHFYADGSEVNFIWDGIQPLYLKNSDISKGFWHDSKDESGKQKRFIIKSADCDKTSKIVGKTPVYRYPELINNWNKTDLLLFSYRDPASPLANLPEDIQKQITKQTVDFFQGPEPAPELSYEGTRVVKNRY